MNRPNGEPEEIWLKDLPTEYYRLNFLADTGSTALQKEIMYIWHGCVQFVDD